MKAPATMLNAVKWRVTMSRCLAVVLLALASSLTQAQQLEPRAYSPGPIGLNFVGVTTLYSTGGVVTDPSLPIQNIDAEVFSAVPFYARTFGLFDHLASIGLAMPYGWATVQGDVQDVTRSVDRSGILDPQLRFALNLIGGPALTPQEFRQRKQQSTLGASLTVSAPLGQYDGSKLINLGTNRWAFKPELGFSQPFGKWTFELAAGVWFFQTNDNFFGGQVRQQDPLASYQGHVVYNFRPNLWAAADYTYYTGGATTINGQSKNDRQDNARGGLTLALPLPKNQSLKVAWAQGVSTRIGSSFQTVGVTWQWMWL
jgi:hypothetical protein